MPLETSQITVMHMVPIKWQPWRKLLSIHQMNSFYWLYSVAGECRTSLHVTVLLFKAAKCTACPLRQTLALVHLQSCCLLWQCMINISNPFMHRRAESKTSSGARVNRYDSFHNGITIWDWETRCLKFSTLALCTVLNSLEVNVLWPLTDILHRMYPLLCCILEQAHWVSLVKEYSSGCRIPKFLLRT